MSKRMMQLKATLRRNEMFGEERRCRRSTTKDDYRAPQYRMISPTIYMLAYIFHLNGYLYASYAEFRTK